MWNHVSDVGENSTRTRWRTSDISNLHVLHFEHYNPATIPSHTGEKNFVYNLISVRDGPEKFGMDPKTQ